MRKTFIRTIAVGLLSTIFTGCPWSTSPNIFEGAKGISLPSFGGPPPQTEPPLEEKPNNIKTSRGNADGN
jgi:hypothetical protein